MNGPDKTRWNMITSVIYLWLHSFIPDINILNLNVSIAFCILCGLEINLICFRKVTSPHLCNVRGMSVDSLSLLFVELFSFYGSCLTIFFTNIWKNNLLPHSEDCVSRRQLIKTLRFTPIYLYNLIFISAV